MKVLSAKKKSSTQKKSVLFVEEEEEKPTKDRYRRLHKCSTKRKVNNPKLLSSQEQAASAEIDRLLEEAHYEHYGSRAATKKLDPNNTLADAKKELGRVVLLQYLKKRMCGLCKTKLGMVFHMRGHQGVESGPDFQCCESCFCDNTQNYDCGEWEGRDAAGAFGLPNLDDLLLLSKEFIPIRIIESGSREGTPLYSDITVAHTAIAGYGSVWELHYGLIKAQEQAASDEIDRLLEEAHAEFLGCSDESQSVDPKNTLADAKKELGAIHLLHCLKQRMCGVCRVKLGVIFGMTGYQRAENGPDVQTCESCFLTNTRDYDCGEWKASDAAYAFGLPVLKNRLLHSKEIVPKRFIESDYREGTPLYSDLTIASEAVEAFGSIWDLHYGLIKNAAREEQEQLVWRW